jgi:hypothetical protein
MSTSSKPGGSSVTGGKNDNQGARNHCADRFHADQNPDQSDTSWPTPARAHPQFRLHRDVLQILVVLRVSFGNLLPLRIESGAGFPWQHTSADPRHSGSWHANRKPTNFVRINNLPNTNPRAGCRTGLGEKWTPVQYRRSTPGVCPYSLFLSRATAVNR